MLTPNGITNDNYLEIGHRLWREQQAHVARYTQDEIKWGDWRAPQDGTIYVGWPVWAFEAEDYGDEYTSMMWAALTLWNIDNSGALDDAPSNPDNLQKADALRAFLFTLPSYGKYNPHSNLFHENLVLADLWTHCGAQNLADPNYRESISNTPSLCPSLLEIAKAMHQLPRRARYIQLPHSEVCMHMKVAGKFMWGAPLFQSVQLYDNNGRPFSAAITRGEAGWIDEP